jgi:murein L,D-transpeptidase YafK
MLRLVTAGALAAFFLTLLSAPAGMAAGAGQQLSMLSTLQPDRVVVLKAERRLVLMRGDQVLKVYRVALGRYAKGAKRRQGDAKTPEGTYTLDYRLDNSAFYKAIHISYPNPRDRARARSMGVDPGGKIMIHGIANGWTPVELGHPSLDWTQGCIAVTNREMDEIWRLVKTGTPIEIHP